MVAIALLVPIVVPGGARAQQRQDMDVQLFLPPSSTGTTFTIPRPQVIRHLTFSAGLATHVGTGLLRRVGTDEDGDVVDWRLQMDLLAALGLFEWLELGAAFPIVATAAHDLSSSNLAVPGTPIDTETSFGVGEARLSLKVPILRGDFALSGRIAMYLPTGDGDVFTGSDYWSGMPSAVFAYTSGGLRVGGELGYRMRRRTTLGDLEYDDELHLALGGGYEVIEGLAVVLEGQLRVGAGGRSLDVAQVPFELDAGIQWQATNGVQVEGGLGRGLSEGYGTPAIRVFAMFRYTNEREPCAAGPEDYDGFDDGDFCADLDNDGDGVEDALDECPNDAEDVDEFLDEDGCPDTDNDADGVADAVDECPLESEDRDGYQDQDGCPERDNDGDGIPDGLDACREDPEDRDGYEDEDGCPEPGPDAATVTVTDTRILISERIYFDFDTDVIRSVSMPLLDQVAAVILELPSDRRIRVDGFTDAEGNDEYNLDLSYRRARAVVEYLSSRGVPRPRLEYHGYGEQNPVAPNDSPEGRALNRRVEFTILNPSDAPVEPPPRRRRRPRP